MGLDLDLFCSSDLVTVISSTRGETTEECKAWACKGAPQMDSYGRSNQIRIFIPINALDSVVSPVVERRSRARSSTRGRDEEEEIR